jgi:hypothetical protein
MTLIVVAVGSDAITMAVDRRVTSDRPIDDDANKLGMIQVQDGFLIYAFTGLAWGAAPDDKTSRDVLDILAKLSPSVTKTELLKALSDGLTARFLKSPSRSNMDLDRKRLALVFADWNGGKARVGVVSNCFDAKLEMSAIARDHFDIQEYPDFSMEDFVKFFGDVSAVTERQRDRMSKLIRDGASNEVVRDFAGVIIRDAPRRAPSGKIGGQVNTFTLSNDGSAPIPHFDSDRPTNLESAPDRFHVGKNNVVVARDFKIEHRDNIAPTQPPNSPCACGKGLRHKDCCGKIPSAPREQWVIEIDPNPINPFPHVPPPFATPPSKKR